MSTGLYRLPFRRLQIPGVALLLGFLLLPCLEAAFEDTSEEAVLYRAINLNGPAASIQGQEWEAGSLESIPNLKVTGRPFENQSVLLRPPTTPAMADLIRKSVFGSRIELEMTGVPEGEYRVFVVVWEDNHSEQFDLLIQNTPVLEKAYTGRAGRWQRLGPWPATATDGMIKISTRSPGHGGINISGVEIWSGEGRLPMWDGPRFEEDPDEDQLAFFERRIRPMLSQHCYECHRAGAKKLGGGLLLDSRAGIQKGGESGAVVFPGDPEASLLIHAVRHTDPELTMPPKEKLSPEEIADLETWIRMGAPDPRLKDTVAQRSERDAIDWDAARQWWSFRPLSAAAPPSVTDVSWPYNEVDRFVLAKMEAEGVRPAPDAERRVLIRRVYFDLIGLPPTPDEVEVFLSDTTPGAFARVVDQLLGRPEYGERWGRHWLDVVRYADTAGDNSDFPIPQMHKYRDWVIHAFNRDLPYDQFIFEQLAGDLLPEDDPDEAIERIVATGYLANARRFGSRVEDYPQHLTIEDTLDNLGRAFLGLTISCARCHDHKFDPITSADYYALYGIFHSTRYPWPGIELDQKQRDLVPLVPPSQRVEAEATLNQWANDLQRLEKDVQRLKEELKKAEESERAMAQDALTAAEAAVAVHKKNKPSFELAYAMAEGRRIEDVPIQRRGDPALPGDVVPRRFLQVLGGAGLPSGTRTSGRLELAGWLTDPSNPLTPRVMVNRLWFHHFGQGLVPTLNDFGRQGRPPSNPELLDWLAHHFIDSGWSIKSMHRLLVLSRTYRQSSRPDPDLLQKDPENILFGAFQSRRIDAESLRDTLLTLGGALDTSTPEPHPFPPPSEWKFTQHNPFRAIHPTDRRSVYMMTQRIQRHPYYAVFDGPDPAASTPVRTRSTTPLQALYLLNDAFIHEQAQRFADRIRKASECDQARVNWAFEMALGRPADEEEVRLGLGLVGGVREIQSEQESGESKETEAWTALARALFRLNEFVYVD